MATTKTLVEHVLGELARDGLIRWGSLTRDRQLSDPASQITSRRTVWAGRLNTAHGLLEFRLTEDRDGAMWCDGHYLGNRCYTWMRKLNDLLVAALSPPANPEPEPDSEPQEDPKGLPN